MKSSIRLDPGLRQEDPNNKEVMMHVTCFRQLMIWLLVFTFSFGGATPAFSGARIMPTGSVKVFQGDHLVQVLNRESALPNGALLTTEGKCGVRLANLYLVAENGATFGVEEDKDRKDLRVDHGVVYFALTQDIGGLAFLTPAGALSAVQIRLNAGTNAGILKGYLDVGRSQVQLGVLEGGAMVVSTSHGEKVVRPGRQITLAFSEILKDEDKNVLNKEEKDDTAAKESTEKEPVLDEQGDKVPNPYLIGGAAVLALGGLAGLGGGGGGGGGGSTDTSPSAPARRP